jgi:predicted GIY-YIG superfamily endonuclease
MEFIYLITNKQNNKVYVGRTCKFEYRKNFILII